jgi:HEPN domain-containing protein
MRDYIYMALLIIFAFIALNLMHKNQKLIDEHTKNLSTEIKVKDEVIKQAPALQKRTTSSRSDDNDIVVEWMREERCQGCIRI